MLRGTRVLTGLEARNYQDLIEHFRITMMDLGFEEVILPSLWEQETFIQKGGAEIVNQMWAFQDKGGRDVCLIPEVTGLVQELWRDEWSKSKKKPYKIFYVNRCYRYERPQAGRYREFTQFGVEILGSQDTAEALECLRACLDAVNLDFDYKESVKRGLSYYTAPGFEAEVASLGSQKQVAGGGAYAEGVGFAIGVDRILLAIENKNKE